MKTTGERLAKTNVAEADREEMSLFEASSVYKKVPCAQAFERTGRRHIGIKWVDIMKADECHWSRLVAQE